jgi:hypothetical protein
MKIVKNILVIAIIFIAPLFIEAQPIPTGPPSQHGTSGNQPGGGAPLDGGLSFLLALSVFYAGKKVYHINKKSE